jgi:3D (Asp-Asp-Asp) domain-containing protein
MRKILLNGLTMMVVLLLGALTGCSSEKVRVTFSDQNKVITIDSSGDSLAEALEDQGVNVEELKSRYKPSIPWDQKTEGQTEIQLACNCKVTLHVGGKKVGTYQTLQPTVGAFLKERNVTLTEWDEVQSPLDQKIVNGMEIVVNQVEQRIKKKVEVVPYKTVKEEDDKLAFGEKETEKEGKKGKNIYEVVMLYKNGKPLMENGQPIVQEKLVKTIEPVDEIVKIGTNKELAQKEENQPKLTSARTMTVEATGYTYTGGRTATGTWPKRGTVAVDPDVIPLGTRLYIPGYGYGIAEDTGGAVDGKIIDLFFETRAEAIRWGRRTVTIQILK